MDVRRIIYKADELNNTGRENEVMQYLEHWLDEAKAEGDWKSELSILSELLGQYRITNDREKGLSCAKSALSIIKERNLDHLATTATIMLNAATTMKAFGKAEQSIEIFNKIESVYNKELDPCDYRFAGLYNNMALSLEDIEEYDKAEQYFLNALSKLKYIDNSQNDMAVTKCNLAQLYEKMDKDNEYIEQCLDDAYTLLNTPELPQDRYHAISISKCIPTFDYFGYFLYAKSLKEKLEKVNAIK